jgi:endonuclease/exonuclease/phosphatase family metal-dependent hydrolase
MRISSWNIEGRLSKVSTSGRGNPEQIVNNIIEINPDVMVLLEAHSETNIDNLLTISKLKLHGYFVYNIPYDDDLKSRPDAKDNRLSMILLSKLPVSNFEIVKLGNTRNCFIADLFFEKNRTVKVIGVHFDDRNESNRLKQLSTLMYKINDQVKPLIILGDFNTMHYEDFKSKLLRNKFIRTLASHILPSISVRATEMAKGGVITGLESIGLIDADCKHRPTTTLKMRGMEWIPSLRLIQIDHIMVSKDINIRNYTICRDGGSDHRAIYADLDI